MTLHSNNVPLHATVTELKPMPIVRLPPRDGVKGNKL